jgi:hypothetical protein
MNELASITALISAAGSVIGLANKASSVESNQKILELQQRLSEVQLTFAELLQENQSLKDDNRKLNDELNAEAMYPFRESARWKRSVDGTEDDGPFCPICFANKKILMPLKFRGRMNTPGLLSFMCPEPHASVPGLGPHIVYHISASLIKQDRYRYPD